MEIMDVQMADVVAELAGEDEGLSEPPAAVRRRVSQEIAPEQVQQSPDPGLPQAPDESRSTRSGSW